jgi:hypothetical protein
MTPDRHPEPRPEDGSLSPRPPAAESDAGLKSQVWVVGLVGIVVILLALFSLVL